ncbi:fimbria/pilus periplasmic chaperone [Citrobacter europaeus]|uniref:fimbria/pilus periplasmic chaperone n=1 Tax=Citrobacter europaeus TaxID=1914243 RepID=UPI0030D540A0
MVTSFANRKQTVKIGLVHMTVGALSIISFAASAGGVSLGATRIVYPLTAQQVSLPVRNSDSQNTFLIKSWVSNPDDTKSDEFVVTPPLFSISAKHENIVRIMYIGKPLPTDRETVFYFNSKAIPPVAKEKIKQNTLQIATQSTIKLFMRPENLASASVDAPRTLRCSIAGGKASMNNPSPYYVTLVNFRIGENKIKNTMLAPMSTSSVDFSGKGGSIKFQTVNDFGALTPEQTCSS